MRIGIYDPYLDTLGGHERYCFDLASCLVGTHEVDIFWDDPQILKKAAERFAISTRGMSLVKNIWKGNFFTKIQEARKYDAIFFVSDGSVPWIFSKKAYLSFEFPVPWVSGKSFFTQLKIRRCTQIICNSLFVKAYIDKTFDVNSRVLTPGVDTESFTPGKKEKRILAIGRFTTGMNTKKQETLIENFIALNEPEWKLILAGGMFANDAPFVEKLKNLSKGHPIDIIPNISFENLQQEYAKAAIYWHAAGFGEDLVHHPERAEHFGISTIEAMSAGAVPVVYAAGGQKEIVGNWVNGFLWKTTDELRERTLLLMRDKKVLSRFGKESRQRAQNFSRKHFCDLVRTLF